MSEIADKVASLGTAFHRGKTKTTIVRHEQDGSQAGKQIEHWDDHVDAVVQMKPQRFTLPLGSREGKP